MMNEEQKPITIKQFIAYMAIGSVLGALLFILLGGL